HGVAVRADAQSVRFGVECRRISKEATLDLPGRKRIDEGSVIGDADGDVRARGDDITDLKRTFSRIDDQRVEPIAGVEVKYFEENVVVLILHATHKLVELGIILDQGLRSIGIQRPLNEKQIFFGVPVQAVVARKLPTP